MRILIAVTATLLIGAGSVWMWQVLRHDEIEVHASLIEAESYATRSDLSRELERQLDALRGVANFWSHYGHLPRDQWSDDARIEIEHFEGFERIVWSDPHRGRRYTTSFDAPELDYRPSDEEWAGMQDMLEGVSAEDGERIYPPQRGADGRPHYRVQIPARGHLATGVVVAKIDAFVQLQQLLKDRSPRYALTVAWDDVELYRRGEPAANIPAAWVQGGRIRLSTGPLWSVTHAPTLELARSFARPAVPALLVAGWVIAVLLGLLIFLYGKSRERAAAAERAEARTREMNLRLEEMVEQRTGELDERTRDLETITESVAHDLRSPLNTIAVSTQLLRERAADERTHRASLDRIARAQRQIEAILGRMDNFSLVTFAEFGREVIDMQALVSAICNDLARLEPEPAPDISIGTLPPCAAQRTLVEILLVNLIGNALKYTRERTGRRIEIGAAAGAERTTYFVRDNGIGFEASQGEALFEPFNRLQRRTGDGRGLGLTIAARIVLRHGGAIRAEGRPGEGATFYFDLGPAART